MKILLVNPPNCGRSIPEERYGITLVKRIFRGEPLSLETLAGNLDPHDVRILDLKVEPDGMDRTLAEFAPDVVGFTGVTCEANTVLKLAAQAKAASDATVVVGGVHASSDPEFFNREPVDYVVVGLGKLSFRELIEALEAKRPGTDIPGVARTRPGEPIVFEPRKFGPADLVETKPPRYDLVARYREHYVLGLATTALKLGFVASAYGCPHECHFCCIGALTGGRYINQSISATLRDIEQLGNLPVIRLVDANTFGSVRHATQLAQAIKAAGSRQDFIADVRADTVVNNPDLLRAWREAGLRSVVVGFEEIRDDRLAALNKDSDAATNLKAVRLLHELGITVVGDFIISPEYREDDFAALDRYLADSGIDLPLITVLTPLPGTPLYERRRADLVLADLDYFTLTNAVTRTILPEELFYRLYAELLKSCLAKAHL